MDRLFSGEHVCVEQMLTALSRHFAIHAARLKLMGQFPILFISRKEEER
jgi:hypothetical protein